ncbi:exopolysaccharide synthesis, ExoD family protein [Lyngbya aestuarii BL J]|uniref:Exopolysaccharide synthesis, ExoD family protein n=1 Tax=Lyngbya aestuarii BL J TaxID=1348334 RepID=U7QPS4_9CYAN|nr:exopolysaccharide biosynthesis protein [Lyngbya aestuarii]ERT09292.1 exopolysaccharide synthesis, ExoD family protein [Lyngbya aestuarii BL J]
MSKLSVELQRYFFNEERNPQVTLADILDIGGERVFGFLFVLLALPSALPVPAPGYSVPFGILLLVLAVQLIVGAKQPWFPQGWLNRPIDLKTVQGFLKGGIPWLQKIELVSRPRLSFICTSFPGRILIGLAIALMSISMMIPIPGTNTLPAIGIFITGFGLLDDDGAISLGGLVVCAIGLTLSTLILVYGYEAVKTGINYLRQSF